MLEFEADLLRHFEDEFPEHLEEIEEKGALSDELNEAMKKVIADFKAHRFSGTSRLI